MRLALAIEMGRLKLIEDELASLQREAADLSEALIVDTREGVPTATLRVFIRAMEAEVRAAISEWDQSTSRLAALEGTSKSKRRRNLCP